MQVFFNGARLPVKSFQDYVALYLKDQDAPRVYERVSERWEVCVSASEGQFQQVGRMPPTPLGRATSHAAPYCISDAYVHMHCKSFWS